MDWVLVLAMGFGDIAELVWNAMNSTAGIVFMAGAMLYGLNKLYDSKPSWAKYEGAIITAIKYAEKKIPDTTENKGMHRLDEALKYAIKVYEGTTKKRASKKVVADLKEGIPIMHDNLEAKGTLKK